VTADLRGEELRAAILAAPCDRARRLVYADWLSTSVAADRMEVLFTAGTKTLTHGKVP
jgi:uncharacterized protein (TIGR02996 family)